MRSVFDPTITEVISLIAKQETMIAEAGKKLNVRPWLCREIFLKFLPADVNSGLYSLGGLEIPTICTRR